MHVAWVSPYLPEPATSGGPIRQQHLARALGQKATVHLFACCDPWERRRGESAELSIFATRWLGRDYWPRWRRESASRRVNSGSPVSMWKAVAELHRQVRLDLVVVSHSWGAAGVESVGVPWLLDEHNIESRYFSGLFASRGQVGPAIEREVEAIRSWERHLWARATGLSCVSADDAAIMTDHRTGAVERSPRASRLDRPVVIENGVDLTTVRHVRPSDRRGGVLFVGSMHHRPNVDAALRLCTEIMPRVWQRRPGLPLVIVGGPIPPELRTAAAQASRDASASVQLPGRVTEMAPYLEDARVYASPLAHGAGSSLKIVEALASGAPLVSSELGARGFGLIPGTHYLAADSNEEHAQAILQLLDQPALAESLGAEGRAMAERYGWHALGARFVDLALTCAACPDSHAMP